MKKIICISIFLTISIFFLIACSAQPEPTFTAVPVLPTSTLVNTSAPTFTCTKLDVVPTSIPNTASLFPPVSGADFSIGPADAPVTLIEYCDFQSQGCQAMSTIAAQLMQNHSNLRFVFRPLPLIDVLDKSEASILAALAADEQGKFWEMYDLLFTRYNEWVNLTPK